MAGGQWSAMDEPTNILPLPEWGLHLDGVCHGILLLTEEGNYGWNQFVA